MKKFLATGLLAICAIALVQQEASAWINSRFSVGLNYGFQSGGNSILWGAWRNGQPPGPEALQSGPFLPYGPVYPQGPVQPYPIAPAPYHHHHHAPHGYSQAPHGGFDFPMGGDAYSVQPMTTYTLPYQFATYPRPVYYYYGR